METVNKHTNPLFSRRFGISNNDSTPRIMELNAAW